MTCSVVRDTSGTKLKTERRMMVSSPCLVCWHGEKCPWHRVGVCRFAHDDKPPVLKDVEDLRHVVRKLAATVLWLSGTDVAEVARVGRG